MIHAHVPTNRPKLAWQDIIKSKEDYTNLAKSGMYWVWFSEQDAEIRNFIRTLDEVDSNSKINKEDFKRNGKYIHTYKIGEDKFTTRASSVWYEVFKRCKTGSASQEREPTYKDCSVEFVDYQNFAEWCQHEPNYRSRELNGRFWAIDKDVILPGNKVYSEGTCCFIPQVLNGLFIFNNAGRGEYPLGCSYHKHIGKLKATCRVAGKNKHLGYFDHPMEAHKAWQKCKVEVFEKVVKDFSYLPEKVLQGVDCHRQLILDDVEYNRETVRP